MKRFKAQQVYASFILLIFGVLFISGCGGSDEVALLRAERDSVNPGTCTEAVGPFVISSNLIDGDNPIPINTLITATFSEAMIPETIKVTNSGNPEVLTFTLKAHNQVDNVKGTVTMNGPLNTIATFKPDTALDINTQYTATITTYAKSALNNSKLSCSYRWSFTTGT